MQRQRLLELGAPEDRIYIDKGLSGKTRDRPGLREALAAVHAGDTLLVTKLDRLARSVVDARAIADELVDRQVSLSLGGQVHNPTDPVGRLLFNVLAMVAEFERDLMSQRTREGLALARQRGRLRGGTPKLPAAREKHLVRMFDAGDTAVGEIAQIFGVSKATVYRAVQRARVTGAARSVEGTAGR